MTPLQVTARVQGEVLRADSIALDGLIAYAVALDLGLPPVQSQTPQERADSERRLHEAMPLERSACGRLYLASMGQARYEEGSHETRYLNRRFPTTEAIYLASDRLKRVQLSSGMSKTYRIPYQAGHLEGDLVTWWALGETDRVRDLLGCVAHLGKKRSVGYGKVLAWEVEALQGEVWEGFPVLLDGRPLRPLPLDWPGLGEHDQDYRCLTFPYWERHRETLCAV